MVSPHPPHMEHISVRQRWHHQEDVRKEWYPYFGDYRFRDPDGMTPIVRNWSDDLLISQGNPVERLGKIKAEIGGNFHVIRRIYSEHSSLGDKRDFGRVANANPDEAPGFGHWRSPQYAYSSSFNNNIFPTVVGSTADAMDRYGTEAIAAVIPTKSKFDLSTALGEFVSDGGLPTLTGLNELKSRASTARRAGSAYLNEEFGWAPLVSDVRKLCHTISHASGIWNKYVEGSGRLMHRKYSWPLKDDWDLQDLGRTVPAPNFDLTAFKGAAGQGQLYVRRHHSQRRWFEGTFMYHVPDKGDKIGRGASMARKLLGIDLTPEVLWNLAPWSWAADWQGNIGDVLTANAAMQRDNLVMPWAYVMETTTESHEFELSGVQYQTYPGEQSFRQVFTTIVKLRQKASPYGFGFDLTKLTPRQIAVLVALGLSKGA
jgi:hypothetical protein